MPFLIRVCARVTRSLMPGIGVLSERVAMMPSAQGTLISMRFSWFAASGTANSVNEAGGGSLFHIASMAANFICWFSVTV